MAGMAAAGVAAAFGGRRRAAWRGRLRGVGNGGGVRGVTWRTCAAWRGARRRDGVVCVAAWHGAGGVTGGRAARGVAWAATAASSPPPPLYRRLHHLYLLTPYLPCLHTYSPQSPCYRRYPVLPPALPHLPPLYHHHLPACPRPLPATTPPPACRYHACLPTTFPSPHLHLYRYHTHAPHIRTTWRGDGVTTAA